jgi:hypothetical protein
MAQQDAMEQVKEFLRQVIKYRFWISIGLAALFALIAYVVGSGPVRAKADDETKKITAALTDVKQYVSQAIPTADYKPIVDEKTQDLGKDVTSAWKTLYNRQAPLLTWPETVQERFRKWGRQWPKDEDPGRVNLAIVDFIEAYPDYVKMVYKTFKPFDYESGEGIVAAPPQDALLRPSVFQVEHLPNLGKVWSAQERLWMQRTVLEVVAQVNKSAKNWDDAIIKQVEELEVGNPRAQDQRSISKGEQLEEAPAIYAPGEEEAEQTAGSSGSSGMPSSGAAGMASMMMGAKGARDGMMGSMMMGGSGGAMMGGRESEGVFFVKSENDKGQYKILPIMVRVLIDQDHIQDFLVELENSPMSIQVMDIELNRPQTRVAKPEKGDAAAGGFGMGMMGGGMAEMMMRSRGGEMAGMGRGMMGFGGMMGMMQGQMSMSARAGGNYNMAGMGMGMAGMGATAARKGTDVRNVDTKKARKEKEKAIEQSKGVTLFDPHFDIVQVTVYGQARFFNPPTGEEPAQPSLGESANTATAAPTAPSGSPTATATTASATPATGGTGNPPSAAPGPGSAEAKQQNAAPPQAAATPGKTEAEAPAKGETAKPETSKPEVKKSDTKTAAPKS